MKIAIKTFHGPNRMTVVAGQAFEDDAEVVKAYPGMFADPAEVAAQRGLRTHRARPVESGTARPGEQSNARRLAPNEGSADGGTRDLSESVRFTSDAASQAAEEAGLTPEAFEGREGSGKDGAFTKADVESIAAGGGES